MDTPRPLKESVGCGVVSERRSLLAIVLVTLIFKTSRVIQLDLLFLCRGNNQDQTTPQDLCTNRNVKWFSREFVFDEQTIHQPVK